MRGTGPMVQMTRRDEAMLEWLGVVRMADMDAVRWALAALAMGEAEKPVSLRKAQQWVARLEDVGLLGRARPAFRDHSIVWATHQAVGVSPPNLYRQTVRHDVAVAAVSARYLARGYTWYRDRRPAGVADHQVDGVAVKGDLVELIEVELTPKTLGRYKLICTNHAARLTTGGVARIVYLCTTDAAKVVAREADKFIFRDQRHRLLCLPMFDVRGKWIRGDAQLWADVPAAIPGGGRTPELWDRAAV